MNIDAFPLQWPAHWPRTQRAQRAQFDTTMAAARDGILRELRLMGVRAHDVVISTDIPLRIDGLPKSNRRVPDDAGVAVYFIRDNQELCIPCDKWYRIQDNMQAIRKTLEALRGIERWGAKSMVDAAFQGFDALPAHSQHGWWVVMGLERDATIEEIGNRFRELVKTHHPDYGGDVDMFHQIQDAYQECKQERGYVL